LAKRLTEEYPEDCLSWTGFGMWYYCSGTTGQQREADNLTALSHFKVALKKARAANEWIRYILFDICRLLAWIERYDEINGYMREILADMEIKREIDIPFFECDWLRFTPEDKIDPDLAKTFREIRAKDQARIEKFGHTDSPATLKDLQL